ncbi:MAG: transposase [Armatimonadota bacterium]
MRSGFIDGFERRRRHLPHWEQPGATYFLTFNLQDRNAVDLSATHIAQTIVAALKHDDGHRYWLYDYVVMPDHVHLLLRVPAHDGKSEALWRIAQSLKGWLSRRINELTGRAGTLWQQETYDHIVRNREDFEEKARYIFQNPYAAGIVDESGEWRWWGRGKGE